MEQTLWDPLTTSGEIGVENSVEDILQALWLTRQTGLDDVLQLPSIPTSIICWSLRILMRKCVYEELSKDEIHKLFLELGRLLKLLLQKFQRQYPKEVMKDQCSKIMRWSMAEQEVEPSQPAALST